MDKEKNIVLTQDGGRIKPNYEREITEIIRGDLSPSVMQSRLERYHENDISAVLSNLSEQDRVKLYRVLDIPMLSDILEYSDENEAAKYLGEMSLKKAVAIISDMEPDTAIGIFHEMPRVQRDSITDLMDDDAKNALKLLASFDEDEIGSKMTTHFISVKQSLSVKEMVDALLEQADEKDNISTMFVVNEANELYGAIDLNELIVGLRDNSSTEELIATSFPYVYGSENVDDCIERLKDYSEDLIPVLDNDNRLIGVITAHNLIEVVDEQMGEDYARLGGLTAEEDLNETLRDSIRKRLPWLFILLGLGLVVSAVVGAFEKVVSQLTLIMAFQSLILDMAGNVGTQSLAVTIRVLIDETLTFKQKLGLVVKEMRVGLYTGTILGVMSFILVGLYIFLFKHKTLLFSYAVSGCIGVSLLLAMFVSSAVGTLIPLFFKKIKIDPAVASGPLITTVNDLVAVVIYYGTSWILLLEILKITN